MLLVQIESSKANIWTFYDLHLVYKKDRYSIYCYP